MIKLRGLSFWFDATEPIFRDISIEFDRGTITAVLGTSGVGKSTLLKLIGGLVKPRSGEVIASETLKWMGYAPQEPALLPWLSVRRNLELGSYLTGTFPAAQDIRDDLVESLGLRMSLPRLPGTLSGGMKKRVAVVSALTSGAAVMLLDEPFAGSDAARKAALIAALIRFVADSPNRLVILTTHDLQDVFDLGASALWLPSTGPRQPEFVLPKDRWSQSDRSTLAELVLRDQGL